jgi:hypothetical protein
MRWNYDILEKEGADKAMKVTEQLKSKRSDQLD